MQIIKPIKLSLISKTYGFKGNQFAVGALCFFKLGADNVLLNENTQWPRITQYLNNGVLLDMGFAKPRGELLVAGKAFAPDNHPLEKMTVSVSLGEVKKSLKVIGDRDWNGSFFSLASQPKPFTAMPLIYQQAYGGPECEPNPSGKGVIEAQYRHPDTGLYDLPNLYHQNESTTADSNERQVAGFGPLDICGPQRSGYQGTYDEQWLKHIHPGFPDDTNARLFNAAPLDQQISGFFEPGDRYRIKGMNADQLMISGRLPAVKVRVFIGQQVGDDEHFKEIQTAMDTVWFFPELLLGVAIYRGVAQVNDSDGLDVKKLLLACDGADHKPRPADYFEQVMKLRLDPKTAAGHMFNESQLMPIKTPQQQAELQKLYAQAKAEQKQKADEMAQLHIAALQADNPDIEIKRPAEEAPPTDEPGPIPQALIDSGDFDLSPYVEYANVAAEKAKAEMEQKLAEVAVQKQQYAKMANKETESVASMQARVNNVVHVLATDLAENTKPKDPGWLGQLPIDKSQADKIREATALMAIGERQTRQSAPSVTVLSVPLPPKGPLKMRAWVIELLESSLSLAGRDLAGADLSGIDFSGLDMRDVMLEQADLSGCDFSGCQLDGAVFTAAILDYAQFANSSLYKANLAQTRCKETRFNHANLSHANLAEALFAGCDFNDANLDEVLAIEADFAFSPLHRVSCEKGHFVQAKLAHSDWYQAVIKSCIFLQPELQHSQWQQVSMTRCMMIEAKAKGVNFCGIRAEKVQFSNTGDFAEADLSAGLWQTCGFRGLDLSACDGRGAVFKGCDFGETNLSDSKFNGALFHGCVMTLAKFDGSDCTEVFFNETALRKCQFNEVNLTDCEIKNADTTEAVFKHCKTTGFKQSPLRSIG